MTNFEKWRAAHRPLLARIARFAFPQNLTLYLVGGAVRDIIAGVHKKNPDLDFCVERNAIGFARRLAALLKAGFVVLDREHGCARVVIKQNEGGVTTLDFSDFRGPTLSEDLLHRDFTVNSMAICLNKAFFTDGLDTLLIDPYRGRKDMRDKVVRLVHPRSFDEDPVRVLRAFSLASLFDFRIEPKTSCLIRAKKNLLRTVAAERVRDELFKIFSSGNAASAIAALDKNGIVKIIFPEAVAMHSFSRAKGKGLDIWKHTLATVEHTERVCATFSRNTDVRAYLAHEVSSGRNRQQVLILAALIHDFGKPKTFRRLKDKVSFHGHERLGASMAAEISARLKLSTEEMRMLKRIVFLHLRPGYLVTNPVLTARAKYRFFRDASTDAAAILLLAIADERSTRGYLLLEKIRRRYERVIPRLLREYFSRQRTVPATRLVDGHRLMRHLGLTPSPLVGKLLRELEEAQALGVIRTAAEALEFARRTIKRVSKKTH